MQKLKLWYLLVMILLLTGCATPLFQGAEPTDKKPPIEAVISSIQETLNNGRKLLLAVQMDINYSIKNRLITHKQAQEDMDDIHRYKKSITDAQVLLDAGDITGAKTQADLYQAAILQLQKRVADAKAKGVSP